MDIDFATGVSGRPSIGGPVLRTVNCYAEASPNGPKKTVRIGRPGLTLYGTLGSGPILRQLQNPGLFNGRLFSVSAGSLYGNTSLISAIPYGTNPRMAATNSQLAITTGGGLYVYDGTTLTQIQFFDDGVSRLPPFSSVVVLYNIFVYTVSGINQFFFSKVGDATSINAANFSFAQTSPGPIIEVAVLAEELYFLKTDRTEIWDFNGSLTAPFAESLGRTYIRGTPAQSSVVTDIDNALFWVGDDLSVYRSSAVPIKVSTPYIDDRLRANADNAAQIISFRAGIEGHWFYVMNLVGLGESYAYDCAAAAAGTDPWAQWGSQAQQDSDVGLYLGQTSTGQGDTIWVGSGIDGRVWLLDASNQTDDGATRQVLTTAVIWLTGGVQRLNNVSLACVRGVGAPDAPAPVAKARFSYDGARTWTSWLDGAIGPVGAYNYKATWRNLGLVQQPGWVGEFKILDPVIVAIQGGSANEPRV